MIPVPLSSVLWADMAAGNAKARERIILAYHYLVPSTARRMICPFNTSLTYEDLVSAGNIGLICAVDLFDLTRGVQFQTYAISKIRGAILEVIRDADPLTRSTRDRFRLMEAAIATLGQVLCRAPTNAEIAAQTGESEKRIAQLSLHLRAAMTLSYDDLISLSGENLARLDTVPCPGPGPDEVLQAKAFDGRIAHALSKLPEREQNVLGLYYQQGFTFKGIAIRLCLSESRIYQIHTRAIERMRYRLQEDLCLCR